MCPAVLGNHSAYLKTKQYICAPVFTNELIQWEPMVFSDLELSATDRVKSALAFSRDLLTLGKMFNNAKLLTLG